ncbi:MAG: hypothetical protein KBD01_16205, partial [Acidobacteria bacterium]|nr:hypothetical protein [Acidobacteriota bacterium]
TRVVHHRHNFLDASLERGSCYECHPGSATRCLRGVMGAAVAADGTMAIQCQGCHGTMSQVGALQRQGWLDEPMCQNCHTGTAVTNSGEIRFTSALDSGGRLRAAADGTFATEADAPGPGLSLYRFSFGHGGLACEACHGSTHAEYASTHANDNIQSIALQGHAGPLAECASCHGTSPRTANGGPHGMHPVGEPWVGDHQERAEHGGASACRECHGTDFRGTVLSRSRADRSLRTKFGTKDFWRGFQVGCFGCHDGPNSEHRNGNRAPVAQGASVLANAGLPLTVTLAATDADRDALALRIVSQPAHGTVGLSGNEARYFPESGYEGADSFTFAAWDGQTDSNLATVSLGIGSVPGPRIASAKGSGSKLKLQGTDFSPNCTVRIDGYPAPRTICTSTQAVSKGKDLKQMLPKGVTVQITLTNNDTGLVSDAFPYTR